MAFGGKKSTKQGLPTEQVNNMRKQGLSDNQIIQNLQRDGFNSNQIFDAMNQADLTNAGPQPIDPVPEPAQVFQQPAPFQQPAAPQQPAQQPTPAYNQPQQVAVDDMDRFEEIAESIIDELWDELLESVNKIVKWKNRAEKRMQAMEQRVDDLKQSFDKLNSSVLGRVENYDKSIKDVGSQIKAMDKVFKDVLPEFSDNLNELNRITKKLKK